MIYECALFQVVKWLCKGTIENYIQYFFKHIDAYLFRYDTYFMFGRYIKKSINKVIRRMAKLAKKFLEGISYLLSTPLPPQMFVSL